MACLKALSSGSTRRRALASSRPMTERPTCSSTSQPSKDQAIESWSRVSGSSSSQNKARRARRRSRCVLPRRGDDERRRGFEERPGRSSSSRPAFRSNRNSDEEALILRDSGKTYAAVASSLGFKRAVDARAAFLRAVRQRAGEERSRLVQRESDRLDTLDTRIRTRDAAHPEKMERRLQALAKLRGDLIAIDS